METELGKKLLHLNKIQISKVSRKILKAEDKRDKKLLKKKHRRKLIKNII